MTYDLRRLRLPRPHRTSPAHASLSPHAAGRPTSRCSTSASMRAAFAPPRPCRPSALGAAHGARAPRCRPHHIPQGGPTCRLTNLTQVLRFQLVKASSGPYTLNEDQIAERGARMARRDDREYREYLREEQRRQPGCPAREVVLDQRGQATSQLNEAPNSTNRGGTIAVARR